MIGESPADRHCGRGATLCRRGPGGPPRHGIDMSLRTTDRDRVERRLHWLLAFTALFSRSGPPTSAPDGRSRRTCRCRSDTHPSRGRERLHETGVGVKRAPPFRARSECGPREPACEATGETTGRRCACQTAATRERAISRSKADMPCFGPPRTGPSSTAADCGSTVRYR